jgi:hypothetical protein
MKLKLAFSVSEACGALVVLASTNSFTKTSLVIKRGTVHFSSLLSKFSCQLEFSDDVVIR